jgi:hypothetical protein
MGSLHCGDFPFFTTKKKACMQEPAIPIAEAERLSALHAAQLPHTPAEESFDRLTRLAARILKVTTVLVSLVGKDKQWFKSRVGMATQKTPHKDSFCAHAILAQDIMVIPDTWLDSRFSDNPLVSGPPHIRSYAGAPLYSIGRMKIGTLCAIGHLPRTFGEDYLHNLHDLARMVEEVIQSANLLWRPPDDCPRFIPRSAPIPATCARHLWRCWLRTVVTRYRAIFSANRSRPWIAPHC